MANCKVDVAKDGCPLLNVSAELYAKYPRHIDFGGPRWNSDPLDRAEWCSVAPSARSSGSTKDGFYTSPYSVSIAACLHGLVVRRVVEIRAKASESARRCGADKLTRYLRVLRGSSYYMLACMIESSDHLHFSLIG